MDQQEPREPPNNPYAPPLTDDANERPAGPKAWLPGIVYGVVWLACTAIAFRYHWRPERGELYPLVQHVSVQHVVIIALLAAMSGAALAVAVVMAFRLVVRRTLPQQPGEWLLAAAGVAMWLRYGYSFCIGFMSLPMWWSWPTNEFAISIVYVCLLALGGYCVRKSKAWATCLIAAALSIGVRDIGMSIAYASIHAQRRYEDLGGRFQLGIWQAALAMLIAAAAMVIAIVLDVRRGTRRGRIHWLGIAWNLVYILVVFFVMQWFMWMAAGG